MLEKTGETITAVADMLCGYPLFITLIGGGIWLFIYSGMISLRAFPAAIRTLRSNGGEKTNGSISSVQALASVVAATVGMGNIAGVAIALVMGGPGAIFWMWVSALVGMSTKYHEGVLAIKYRSPGNDGRFHGGTMHIIERGLGPQWRPLAVVFATAGLFGTLCIMNANQLTEAIVSTFATPAQIAESQTLHAISEATGMGHLPSLKLIIGLGIAATVSLVVLGGVGRIARVASVLVPFMVSAYFLMVLYIIATHINEVPGVFRDIFTEAFSLRAGWGALAGIAIIGARRAALVNDAGIGTASIMHGESTNNTPVKEGLVAMIGPSIDSGLVCTLTAVAILLCGDISSPDVKGLEIAMAGFGNAIPAGEYMLMAVVFCFAMSSMFSYSFYGSRCAAYLFGEKRVRLYTFVFIATLVIFAVIPLKAAVGLCDLFYALMAFPTMLTLILLRKKVKEETELYFSAGRKEKQAICEQS